MSTNFTLGNSESVNLTLRDSGKETAALAVPDFVISKSLCFPKVALLGLSRLRLVQLDLEFGNDPGGFGTGSGEGDEFPAHGFGGLADGLGLSERWFHLGTGSLDLRLLFEVVDQVGGLKEDESGAQDEERPERRVIFHGVAIVGSLRVHGLALRFCPAQRSFNHG